MFFVFIFQIYKLNLNFLDLFYKLSKLLLDKLTKSLCHELTVFIL